MKLLQVPTSVLEERIKEEIEENPALDVGAESDEQEVTSADLEIEGNDEVPTDEPVEAEIEPYETYLDEDEVGDYKLKEDQVPELPGNLTFAQPVSSSLHELLADQLRLLNLDPTEERIAEQIIGSIDEGYKFHR